MAALTMLESADAKGEVVTGVLYVNTEKPTFIDLLNMVDDPVGTLPQSRTRPPKSALDEVMEELR
jgi:2-oxoglutarate ferredoxin oxidoreductase subunit beta